MPDGWFPKIDILLVSMYSVIGHLPIPGAMDGMWKWLRNLFQQGSQVDG